MDHEGDYTCTASNDVDTCSSHCELLVEELPPTKPLSDSEVRPNEEVELSIEVEKDPSVDELPAVSVTWFKDEIPAEEIAKDGTTSKYEMDSKKGKHTLKFTPTGVEDQEDYKVVVKNNEAKSLDTERPIERLEIQQDFQFPEIAFEIKNEPEFVSVPKDLAVPENDRVVLRCSAAGNPVPDMKWINEKKEDIPEHGRIRHETKDGYSSLIIEDADLNDEGFYTCIASNSSGEVSTTVELLVDEVQKKTDDKPLAKPPLEEIPIVIEQVDKVFKEPTETELR